MIDPLYKDFSFYQAAISLRQQRQEVLASNIANADTPNYKARDFDFKQALRNDLGDGMRLPDTHLTRTSSRHITGKTDAPDPARPLYRTPAHPTLDAKPVHQNMTQ